MRLFLYGTLLQPELRARRGGSPALRHSSGEAARLLGWERMAQRGARWPTLRRRRCAVVDGLVLPVGAAALARFGAWEGPAYRLYRVVVQTSRGNAVARCWTAPGTCRRWRSNEMVRDYFTK